MWLAAGGTCSALGRSERPRLAAPLAEPQIAALLRLTEAEDLRSQRDRILLMLGLFAGLRTGEMHRLRWRDIHLDQRMLEVVGKADKPGTVAVSPSSARSFVAGTTAWRRVPPPT